MFRFRPFKTVAAGLALLLASHGTDALAATCGLTGSATATPATYDPFNPAGLATATVTLNLTRINGAGGEKTDVVNFFLRSSDADADGTSIIPTSVVIVGTTEGTGLDIFYDFAESAPIYAPTTVSPSAVNRFLKLEFTGNNAASDTAQVTFTVQLPANLNLNASTDLPFNAIFSCSTTGGGPPTQQTGELTNAVIFPITVLSALQATFAGTALDFGEIGTVTNAQASTINTGVNNYIRVQSSGAYQVTLQSANAFRLKHPTGSLANATERVAYALKFLGATRDNTTTPTLNAVALTQNCARAGVGVALEDHLHLLATLQEGGVGKTPGLSSNYSDTLTVTITPQAIGVTYPTDCNAFTVP